MAGPKNATTNSDGIRVYEWTEGSATVELLSVTSLRRLAGIPFGLAAWQVNQVIAAALGHLDTLAELVASEGEDVARKWLRREAMLTRDEAASKGIAVHEAASIFLDPKDAAPEVAPYLRSYYDWMNAMDVSVLFSEKQVFNLTLGYAGSVDLVIEVPDGSKRATVVADIKTGKGLYADHALQLIAYAMGEFVGEDGVIDIEATKLLKKASRLAVVHLGEESWEYVEIDPTPDLLDAFKAQCVFANWLARNPDLGPLITRKVTS